MYVELSLVHKLTHNVLGAATVADLGAFSLSTETKAAQSSERQTTTKLRLVIIDDIGYTMLCTWLYFRLFFTLFKIFQNFLLCHFG